MREVDFVSELIQKVPEQRNPGLSVVIYGIDPIPGQLDNAIETLRLTDDVVVYNIDRGVYLDGKPERLPRLIENMHDDISSRMDEDDRLRFVAASLGTFAGLNIQIKMEKEKLGSTRPALYVAGGSNLVQNLVHYPSRPVARLQYLMNGYDEKKLREAWMKYDFTPDRLPVDGVAFYGMLTKRDQYVWYGSAKVNLDYWTINDEKQAQEQGRKKSIELEVMRAFGHTAVINRFNKEFPQKLKIADELDSQVAKKSHIYK